MGQGDYHGGSTVIGPRSGWFSGFDAPSEKSSKPKKPSPAALRETYRLQYIHSVVQAELKGKVPPPLHKKARASLQRTVADCGGPTAWARSQPEYKQVREKKVSKKKTKAALRVAEDVKRPAAEVKAQTEHDIAAHLIVIEAALAQVSVLMGHIADRQAKIEELLKQGVERVVVDK